MSMVFGADPVRAEVEHVLSLLDDGQQIDDSVERQFVDLKEEHGRRDRSGFVGPSDSRNERAAKELAAAAACMANTPGGGALIVGVSNSGDLIGTDLESEWLRHRLYELTHRSLTVDIVERTVAHSRVLVITAPRAIEPIRYEGRIRWRVGTNCVEVDPNTWHAKRMSELNYDWSAQESALPATAARAGAIEQARAFLIDSGEAHAAELARDSNANLLRRLNAVTGQGLLTNAGVIAFVGRDDPCLDYIRRDRPAGDSTMRVRKPGRSLIEELAEVFLTVEAHNATVHLRQGLSIGQFRELPPLATREAIVNGVAHREWGIADPTVVEHVGRTLRVTSPGGFVGGVNENNIITHPSRSRNRALTELLAALRVAEREGIGVDRMTRDMVALGHQPPDIREISGPYVRASLIGDNLDVPWLLWLRLIQPPDERDDLNSLLLLRHLVHVGWVDVRAAAPIIQLTVEEARGAVEKLASARMPQGQPVIERIAGVPPASEPAWHLTVEAARHLKRVDRGQDHARTWPTREDTALGYARARGRISSTELASLVGASPSNVGAVLKRLEDQGSLAPSRANRRGPGFFYRPVPDAFASPEL